jgi:hypothetical protein
MTQLAGRPVLAAVKDRLAANPDGLRAIVRAVMLEVLEAR